MLNSKFQMWAFWNFRRAWMCNRNLALSHNGS